MSRTTAASRDGALPRDGASPRGTVLLDLDGTISDPAAGIFSAFRHAVASVGHPWPDERPLDWIIGPPLRETFFGVLGDKALAEQALLHYREHYGAGAMYDNTLYPGMQEVIAGLAASGRRLFVATSKLTQFAEKIVQNFGLTPFFQRVYGSSLDGTLDQKADIIALALKTERVDPAQCVMVGDRKHDALGAAANSLPCIGVAWGYGGVEELRVAGVAMICKSPAELASAIGQVIDTRVAAETSA